MKNTRQTCPACMGQYKTDVEGRMGWHLHNPTLRAAPRETCPGVSRFGIETSTEDARWFAREYLKRGGAHAVAAAEINAACDAEGDATQMLVQLTSDFIISKGWRPRLRHRRVGVRPEELLPLVPVILEQNVRLREHQPDLGACWSLQPSDVDGFIDLRIWGQRSRHSIPLEEMRDIDRRYSPSCF